MRRKQKVFVRLLVAAGLLVAIVSAIYLTESFCRQQYAENLILRKTPRSESRWDVMETGGGHLFRIRNGKFRGWYLAADDLVHSRDYSPARGFGLRGRRIQGPHVRNLILRERLGRDCYFTVTEAPNGMRIQAAGGRYKGWYLHLWPDYVPDFDTNPRTAWNLVLMEQDQNAEAVWKLIRDPNGDLVQATAPPFDGWVLDALLEATILERNICWGEENPRDGPTPPLAR